MSANTVKAPSIIREPSIETRKDKRKPLPYAASWLIDAVLMNNTEITRILMAIVEFNMTKEEELRQIVRVLALVNDGTESLKEIKQAGK